MGEKGTIYFAAVYEIAYTYNIGISFGNRYFCLYICFKNSFNVNGVKA